MNFYQLCQAYCSNFRLYTEFLNNRICHDHDPTTITRVDNNGTLEQERCLANVLCINLCLVPWESQWYAEAATPSSVQGPDGRKMFVMAGFHSNVM
jgi:hypothetical protein